MKRIVTVIFCLLVILLFVVWANFCYGAKPVTVKLSFTAPQKGQQLKEGLVFTCKGKFQCDPRNTKLNQIHIWLFLLDRDGNMNRYWIQKPVTLNNKGLWEGPIKPAKGTVQVAAVLADPNTDKLFKTWLSKGNVTKQYELPRGAQILTMVGVKTVK
ncbi:MAG TPA: hypothetical protein VHY08_04055 [Bacillota bacterium]|nr:hypothetical protein [Bacillota bacterium]